MILSISVLALLAVGSCLLWTGCGNDDEGGETAETTVIASTTQLADLARNVAGERTDVVGILSANSDPHDYEPQPSDAEAVIDADLILKSGGDLDEWLDELVESSGSDASQLVLIDQVETLAGEASEETDPHWWQDPRNAIAAVEAIRDELIAVDPGGSDEYERNAAAYVRELEQLDLAVGECIERIPVAQRKLVTSHDALGYFADRYGIEVVGAAIPALSTQAQASAGETAELVDLIDETGVKAIFPEAGVSGELEQAIATEADATVGGELWADTLGPEGSGGATYVDAIESNAAALADGLTGGGEGCSFK